jgi:hypothetical protein
MRTKTKNRRSSESLTNNAAHTPTALAGHGMDSSRSELSRVGCRRHWIGLILNLVPSQITRAFGGFLYRCPNTGYRVHAFVAEEVSEDPERYEAVTCIARQRVHLVNPTSGRVLGAEEE